MDKQQTENPAGKAIHHFKVVGLLDLLIKRLQEPGGVAQPYLEFESWGG